MFYLVLGYIYFTCVFIHCVCVAYPLNVGPTMKIRKSHLCDFFLVLPFFITFFSVRDHVLKIKYIYNNQCDSNPGPPRSPSPEP